MELTPELLAHKYGDSAVMGVTAGIVKDVLKEGFTSKKDAAVCGNGICCSLRQLIERAMTPRLRREAELDPSFKQIIPYAV